MKRQLKFGVSKLLHDIERGIAIRKGDLVPRNRKSGPNGFIAVSEYFVPKK